MEVQVLSTAPLLTIAALQPGLADHGRTKLNLDFDFDPAHTAGMKNQQPKIELRRDVSSAEPSLSTNGTCYVSNCGLH